MSADPSPHAAEHLRLAFRPLDPDERARALFSLTALRDRMLFDLAFSDEERTLVEDMMWQASAAGQLPRSSLPRLRAISERACREDATVADTWAEIEADAPEWWEGLPARPYVPPPSSRTGS